MHVLLTSFMVWVLSSALARVVAGAGLAFATYSFLADYVNSFLSLFTSGVGGLGSVGVLMQIAGIGEAISIIGSAILSSVAMMSARMFLVRN